MKMELTEEQKKLAEENLSQKSEDKIEDTPKGDPKENDSIEDNEFLANAKKLKEDQEALIKEREKLDQDKKEFNRIMQGREQRGRAMTGQKELTQDEIDKNNAKKLVEGTGLDPFA